LLADEKDPILAGWVLKELLIVRKPELLILRQKEDIMQLVGAKFAAQAESECCNRTSSKKKSSAD